MTRINLYSLKQVKEHSELYDVCGAIKSPEDSEKIISAVLEGAAVEKLGILALNTKNKVTGIHIIAMGGLSSISINAREVFIPALLNNAASVILFHNHPSGDCEPSPNDVQFTKRITEAGKMLGINVLDHIVIGDNESFASMKRQELF